MKIYRIEYDADNYQHLEQDFDETTDFAIMDERLEKWESLSRCQSLTKPLTPPEVLSPRPKLNTPDFWYFSPYHTFAMSPASLEKVLPFLEEAGELLPIPYRSEIFSALNVLVCVDYQVFPEDTAGRLHQEHAAGSIPSGIFRDSKGVYLYVSELTGTSTNEFKAYVENEEMTGLIFRQVWDSKR